MITKLYPVIHYQDDATMLDNAAMAVEAGVAGVFLIQHGGLDHLLNDAFSLLRQKFPMLRVGVNRLSTDPEVAVRQDMAIGANFSWLDSCGIHSGVVHPTAWAPSNLVKAYQNNCPEYRLFGSVAFKYQPIDIRPDMSARMAVECGFIPTTSGSATGVAADIEKICDMCAVVGRDQLALASGITAENAPVYVPYVQHLLVSTGISKSFHQFDAEKLKALMKAIT